MFDVQAAVANLRTAVRYIGRAMDLCDQQEIAAWRLLAAEQGRTIELDDMVIRLQRGQLNARRGQVTA